MSVGMGIDLRAVASDVGAIAAGVAGLMAVKVVLTTLLTLTFGQALAVAVPVGILLAQGGEFAFVVIGSATLAGIISGEAAQYMIVVASLSMLLTPFLAEVASWAGARLSERAAKIDQAPLETLRDVEDHVIIAGYGRVGQVIAHLLDAQGISHVGLDLDAGRIAKLRKRGMMVFYGDARQGKVLETLGAERAAALVVTLDDPDAAAHLVAAVKSAWAELPIYARARDRGHAETLLRLGAAGVIPETSESSLQLAGLILNGLGVPLEAVDRMIHDVREQDYGETGLILRRGEARDG